MCRNIKTLHNFAPPATDDEIRASSLQFVRKLSGFTRPSKANEVAFARAVDQVTNDVEGTKGVRPFHAPRPQIRKAVQEGPQRPRRSRERLDSEFEIKIHAWETYVVQRSAAFSIIPQLMTDPGRSVGSCPSMLVNFISRSNGG